MNKIYYKQDIDNCGFFSYSAYVDQYGEPVERTPIKYPYSYDFYITARRYKNEEVTNSVYSDRLYQSDYTRITNLIQKHCKSQSQNWSDFSVEQLEKVLSEFFNLTDLKICYIMKGCNVSTGYPIWYIAFKN